MVWAVSLSTTDLSTRSLTPGQQVSGIRSLTEFGNPVRAPRPISALPPCLYSDASPKAISGRTSYLRVRLEFLRYPHLIATFFNRCAFGPPPPFTAASTWTWVGHPVSGLCLLTGRPIKTWFPFGSGPLVLNLASQRNSPDRSTKSTRLSI